LGKRGWSKGNWRKLHEEDLRDLYSSPNTAPVIKLGGKRWTGHVARMWDYRNANRVLDEETSNKDCWEDLGIGGK